MYAEVKAMTIVLTKFISRNVSALKGKMIKMRGKYATIIYGMP
jgi:hypothetical protein